MVDCTLAETPIIINHGLQMIEGEKLADRGSVREWLESSSIFHTYDQRLLNYAVGVVSKFMH